MTLTPATSREQGGIGCLPEPGGTPPVSGMSAWYDPSNAASVTVGAAGLVTAVADLSGNGLDSTSVSGNVLLARREGYFNGRAAFYFESSDGNQIAFTNTPFASRPVSVFAVALAQSLTGGRNPTMLGPSADGGLELRVNSAPGDGKIAVIKADTSEIAASGAHTVAAGEAFAAGCCLSPTSADVYLNLDKTVTANAVAFTAGRTLVLGRAPTVTGAGDRLFGWLGETIIYPSALSESDALDVLGYLIERWGI